MIVALHGDPADYCTGENLKHVTHWYNEHKKDPDKTGTEELENAVWYLQFLIAHEKEKIKKDIDALNAKLNGGVR